MIHSLNTFHQICFSDIPFSNNVYCVSRYTDPKTFPLPVVCNSYKFQKHIYHESLIILSVQQYGQPIKNEMYPKLKSILDKTVDKQCKTLEHSVSIANDLVWNTCTTLNVVISAPGPNLSPVILFFCLM